MLLLALAAAAPPISIARPGDLNRGFGGDGRVATVVSGGAPRLAGIAAPRGGRTLVAGSVGDRTLVLLRYLRDGRLDRGFGTRGVVRVPLGESAEFRDMALTPGGEILVAGAVGTRAVVARFDTSGRLDPTFGTAGIAAIPLGGTRRDVAVGVAVQPDGRAVAAGAAENEEGGPFATRGNVDLAVARLDHGGALDPSFGSGGIARMPAEPHDSLTPTAVTLLRDGRVLLSADYFAGLRARSTALAVRLLADGSPDASFGTFIDPGRRPLSGGDGALETTADVALDARTGDALVVGAAAFVPRDRNPDDGPAPMWVSSLRSARFLPVGPRAAADAVTFDGRSRPLLAGAALTLAGRSPRFAVVRLDRRNRPDRCFGTRGRVTLGFDGRPGSAQDIAVGRRGAITVAGTSGEARPPRRAAFVLARLRGGNCHKR